MNKIKGDLVELAKRGQFDMIVHGCNCFNFMGCGIARQIKQEFPVAYEADCDTSRGDRSKLGTFTFARHTHWYTDWKEEAEIYLPEYSTFYIINAYTQYSMSNKIDLFEYTAFTTFLRSFENFCRIKSDVILFDGQNVNIRDKFSPLIAQGKLKIGFPMIGAGLAGGDWVRIERMLRNFAERIEDLAIVTIVEYDGGIPTN